MTKRPDRAFAIRDSDHPPLVAVIDDDESVRESLPDLLQQLGFETKAFASAREFLSTGDLTEIRCLLLDVAMPGMSGPELQQALLRREQAIPVVYLTAQADDRVRQRLLAKGAVACLFKPFTEDELQAALNAAIHQR
jgi:FixJ family two-component response regulator